MRDLLKDTQRINSRVKIQTQGVPFWLSGLRTWLVSMRMRVQSLASLRVLRICVAVSCGVGRRWGLGLTLLWLWCRPAAAALIWPLAWELPCAADAALKIQKNKIKIKLQSFWALQNPLLFPLHKSAFSQRLKGDSHKQHLPSTSVVKQCQDR